MIRITAACPEAMRDDANHLAMCLGQSEADANTYGDPVWQDLDGNLYAAASFVARPEWLAAATGPLRRPEWDAGEVIDMIAAARAQAIEHLVGVINDLLWAPAHQSRTPAPGLTLTDLEARALHLLDRRRGAIVSHANLVAAVYAEVPEDRRPDPGNITIIVMKLRRKLTQAGVAAEIATERGAGYRLIADRGTFDWTI